jgi:hypothetical protein
MSVVLFRMGWDDFSLLLITPWLYIRHGTSTALLSRANKARS